MPQYDLTDERRIAIGSKREAIELQEFVEAAGRGDVDEMNLAIRVTERLWKSLPQNHIYRPLYMHYIGRAAFRRVLAGRLNELDVAIELCRRVLLHSIPRNHHNRGFYVSDYFRALYVRFDQSRSVEDLNQAIQLIDYSLPDISDRHQLAACLDGLGEGLFKRFNLLGCKEDLQRAAVAYEQCLDLGEGWSGRLTSLHNFGGLLLARSDLITAPDLTDLNRAITIMEEAVNAISPSNSNYPKYLNGVSIALLRRFSFTMAAEDLDAAIARNDNALRVSSDSYPHKGQFYATRCHALRCRYTQTGQVKYLNEAIIWGDRAISFQSSCPSRASNAVMLGDALYARFEETYVPTDFDKAVSAYEIAIALETVGHPKRLSHLNILGRFLLEISVRKNSRQELDRAIDMHQEAVNGAAQDDRNKPSYIFQLGRAYVARSNMTRSLEDLERAKDLMMKIVDSVHDVSFRSSIFNNLALIYFHCFILNGSQVDLNQAIETSEKAILDPAQGPTLKAAHLLSLGNVLQQACIRTASPEHRLRALAAYEECLETLSAPPTIRITAACSAALLYKSTNIQKECQLLKFAVEMLPMVSPRTLHRGEQQLRLSRLAGVATSAASASLETGGSVYEALQILEVGKAVTAHQLLDARSDITLLEEAHPNLAERFKYLRNIFDTDSEAGGDVDPFSGTENWALRARRQYDAATDFDAIIQQIRTQEGFERFLLGPLENELISIAASGPIVIFNVSQIRSDAILVTFNGLRSLRLPELKNEDIIKYGTLFRLAQETIKTSNYANTTSKMKRALEWLWDVAVGPVLNELGFNQTPISTELPRIWWAANGLLNILPLPTCNKFFDIILSSRTIPRVCGV